MSGDAEALAEVIAKHWNYGPADEVPGGWECECGALICDDSSGDLDVVMHAHVATRLAAYVAAERDRAVAETLAPVRALADRADARTDVNHRLVTTIALRAALPDEPEGAGVMADTAEIDTVTLEPWGPFEMGGFEGCTAANPEHCACSTHQQPQCEICGQQVEPGEQAWARCWPCYNTLPLNHRDQEWDVISWHDRCPAPGVIPPASTALPAEPTGEGT